MMNGFILQENTSILISRNGKTLYSILHRSLDLTHHINDYIKSKVMENIKGKNNIIKFSTLQYFHKELDLDRKINNKKKLF